MSEATLGVIETKIPSRLDRLPWSRFHWLIVLGLGTAWILDGLEVTIVGSVASRITSAGSGITITAAGIGEAAALYVAGACIGALVFGHLTDRLGRKKLFLVTLALYMLATAVTAVSFAGWIFFIFRFLTGAGIGGEYAAINSAIDELIPARARGRIDLVINGSYWVGSIVGSALSIFFLDTAIFPRDIGWRLTFAIGVVLASVVMLVRRHVPESPRWLFIHGHEEEAEALVDRIEQRVRDESGAELQAVDKTLVVHQRRTIGFRSIVHTAIRQYPKRSVLCIALFVGQAFIYNGITFNLGTLMSKFFHVSTSIVPMFLILYAAANFLGPLLLGRWFDTVGRVPMITGTYLGSALLGIVLAGIFAETTSFGRWSFIAVVMVTFFLASAGASAAYLTSSEIFPMETRALAIAFFYAIGTAAGGIAGPLLFGPLITTGNRRLVGLAFFIGAVLMAGGAVTELAFGVRAERRQLEDVARPLTVEGTGAELAPTTHATARVAPTGPMSGDARARGQAPPTTARHPERLAADHHAQAADHRAQAADHRAQAADHRARLHAMLAGTIPEADGGIAAEEALAQVADERALAEDERAAAAEARVALAGDGERPEAEPDGSEMESVRAAELRARSHEEAAEALVTEDERDAERHRHLATAALEGARGAEQRAMAIASRRGDHRQVTSGSATRARPTGATPTSGGSGGDAAGAVRRSEAYEGLLAQGTEERCQLEATMHEAWASMHAHRATAFELRAAGHTEEAHTEERAADADAERARAFSYRAQALRHRSRATAEREAFAGEPERSGQLQRRTPEQAREEDRQLRERVAHRREREVAGLRRYRPGPGRLGRTPGSAPAQPPEEALDHEVAVIERALYDHGPTDSRELARMVGARYWGPGVFTQALREALAQGAVRRLSRRVYAPRTPGGSDISDGRRDPDQAERP